MSAAANGFISSGFITTDELDLFRAAATDRQSPDRHQKRDDEYHSQKEAKPSPHTASR